MSAFVLIAHLASTLYMTGLIWFVQVVHYPLFARVGAERYEEYQLDHQRLTSLVVGPPMLVELATALWLVAERPAFIPAWSAWAGLALVAVIWASTALLQVPQHNALAGGFSARAHALLVGTNWLRTIAWTARAALVLWWVGRGIGAWGLANGE